jgi:hypothetical protein
MCRITGVSHRAEQPDIVGLVYTGFSASMHTPCTQRSKGPWRAGEAQPSAPEDDE